MKKIITPKKELKNFFLDILILIAITGFLLSFFQPQYLFSKTITSGGDTGSHYFTVEYLKEILLPQGKMIGWTQGNYAGFPFFLFYFPLSFLFMVFLSLFIPLQVAFKLGTVLGIFLLPICTYFSLRKMKFKFPVPVLGALFTLPFLFMEANSMWGGNIFSTLAGEFAFSLGFALSILFLGMLHEGILSGRHVIRNGILIALIGFSHGYALLFAGFASLFFLITTRKFLNKLGYLIKVHGLGFLLMGFWIIPLLWNLPYATRFNIVWTLSSIFEVFPVILLPFIGLAVLGRLAAGIWAVWKDRGLLKFKSASLRRLWDKIDLRLCYLWYCILLSGYIYFVAFRIHVVDVRFLPFVQILLCILAAVELGRVVALLKKLKWIPIILLTVAVFLWVDHHEKNVGNWIKWNYTGFEGKPMWPTFFKINQALHGSPQDPRVVYEHATKHNEMGTVRAFEALPLFSGRSTLEGLYIQASLSVPFVFYIQSEVSLQRSCPLPDYSCSKLDLENGIRHLKMFNVRDYIVVSDEVKAEVSKYPELKLKLRLPPYEVYELTTNENKYVVPLKYEPVLFETNQWKKLSYQWFKKAALNDIHLVFLEKPSNQDLQKFKTVRSGEDLSDLPKIPVEGSCRTEEEIRNEEILIKTDCIHKPLLVKFSYHPNWKITGADQIYLVSPSFMLIYPNQENIRLVFSRNWIDHFGSLLTLFGFFILIVFLPRFSESGFVTRLRRMERNYSKRIGAALTVDFLKNHRIKIFVITGGILVLSLFSFAVISNQEFAESLYVQGVKYNHEKKYVEARVVFEKVIKNYPDTRSAINSYYLRAISYFLEGNYAEGIDAFEKLIHDYPDSEWIPESYYHIGLCHLRMGNPEKALKTFQFVIQTYSSTVWAKQSELRLTEMNQVK